jgi:uncharacterized protein (DUF58 family)
VALPNVALSGEWGGAGHSTSRSVATHGDDDVATREYRQGDDLRRIHWRTTARRGELTVRREEQPWQSRGAVLLDTRLVAHRGDGPASSLEWAISAAASISLHLARAGFELRVISDTGNELSTAGRTEAAFDGNLLDVMAVLSASGGNSLRTGLDMLKRHGTEGLLIAIVGVMTPDDAEALARMRGGSSAVGVAVVLDADSWVTVDPEAAEASASAHARSCELLVQSGWRVIQAHRGESLADLWPQAGRSTGPAVRAFSTQSVATDSGSGDAA